MGVSSDRVDLNLVFSLKPSAPIWNHARRREFVGQKRVFCAAAVCRGAGPGESFRVRDHFGSDWVSLDISDSRPDVGFVKRAGEKSALPKMSRFAAALVDCGGKSGMGVAKAMPKRVLVLGNDNPVNVI